MYGMENTNNCMTPAQLVDWAKANLNIIKLNAQMTDEDIGRIMRWIGECSYDTIYVDGDKPRLGRVGIGNMLFTTMMEFPEFYMRYELWQRN
jgi:hypothetical protein